MRIIFLFLYSFTALFSSEYFCQAFSISDLNHKDIKKINLTKTDIKNNPYDYKVNIEVNNKIFIFRNEKYFYQRTVKKGQKQYYKPGGTYIFYRPDLKSFSKMGNSKIMTTYKCW